MQLTETQRDLVTLIERVGRDVFYPLAARWDDEAAFPRENHERLKEIGLYGILVPEVYGGLGLDAVDFVLALEALGRSSSCGATLGLLTTQTLSMQPLLIAGSEEQKQRYLPAMARGDALAAFALTEAESGSDAASLATVARAEGDEYVLRGRKAYCTHGNVADYITVFAKTDARLGTRGISAFLVDARAPGVGVTRVEKKMGLRGSPSVELSLDDVRVPAERRIGKEGQGFQIAMETLEEGRLAVAADSVGIMRFCIDYALDYARTRSAFRAKLLDLQAIQFMLADMEIAHDAAQALTYRAALALRDRSPDVTKRAAAAKCFATDVRQQVVSDAIQILGGAGYMEDHPLERIYRDSKVYQIFDGTNQIQRLVIARHMTASK